MSPLKTLNPFDEVIYLWFFAEVKFSPLFGGRRVKKLVKILATAAVLSGGAWSQANATAVTFTGNGNFTDVSGCGSGSPGCSISNGGNQLNMSGSNNFGQPSTLLITDITDAAHPVNTPTNNTIVGELTWTNRATFNSDQNFSVDYTYTLNITNAGQVFSKTFDLNVQQLTNSQGDEIFNLNQLNLGSITVGGITVSDIKFQLASDTNGTYSFDNATNSWLWTNPDPRNDNGSVQSVMYITADFTAAVPEPSTWAMMILGFCGVGFLAYRRKQNGPAFRIV
jgi:hypothetical protein